MFLMIVSAGRFERETMTPEFIMKRRNFSRKQAGLPEFVYTDVQVAP